MISKWSIFIFMWKTKDAYQKLLKHIYQLLIILKEKI